MKWNKLHIEMRDILLNNLCGLKYVYLTWQNYILASMHYSYPKANSDNYFLLYSITIYKIKLCLYFSWNHHGNKQKLLLFPKSGTNSTKENCTKIAAVLFPVLFCT